MLFFVRKNGRFWKPSPTQNGWLCCLAATATVLLALFVTLNALAEDQTGLSFYYGTDAFRDTCRRYGLPARLTRDQLALSPDSSAGGDRAANSGETKSTETEPEALRSYVSEVKKDFDVLHLPAERARAAVDFYLPLKCAGPQLTDGQKARIKPMLELIRDRGGFIEIVVWVPTQHETALIRSATLARDLREEIIAQNAVPEAVLGRVASTAQSWRYKELRRPAFSVVITRQAPLPAR